MLNEFFTRISLIPRILHPQIIQARLIMNIKSTREMDMEEDMRPNTTITALKELPVVLLP